ncbi:uncharacterized protein LOC112520680 [Cynara cardunculus var. scolymus]|uniref:Transmembrane protein n=1 Tax=Cynara cardunculus var. scolymus TaxID=59895 RepID=A0A124SBK4_CYNCS|nr:uncharacterized protein LOC112520680 [Cynara cardunculus var. scolymus]KVH90926.1 hypothetical protein Ccrd_007057 [Cynara cardunculus var. scolymus]
MMATGILYYVQRLWPFATSRDDDLRVSDGLVRGLEIPDETKRFVFAIREPESQAVIYILCAQNLSERSAVDAERLVRCVRPGAVVAQVNDAEFDDVQLLGDNGGDGEHSIPTSSLEVLMRCFLHKIGKDKYEDVAGSLVLKEIFGVGFNGHFLAAKRMAEEVGSSFLLLESPFVKLESQSDPSSEIESGNNFQGFGLQPSNLMPQKVGSMVSSSTSRYLISDDHVRSQMLKSLCSHLVQLSSDQNMGPVNIQPKDDYEVPQYARSVYPLLEDLRNIFVEIPAIERALGYAQKMLHDVSKGDTIDTRLLSEIYAFRVAVEGLRIALNNAGRMPISKTGNRQSPKMEFSSLPHEEQSHALLAHALRSQTKNFKSVVAIIDASTLAGLRKHWNTAVPPEVKNTVEELIDETGKDGETTNQSDKKRRLTNKPVVAVGAGATAVLGASSLSKVVPASTFIKVVTFKVPASLKLIMTQTQKLVSISISKFLGPSKVIAPSMFNSGLNTTSSMKAAASAEKIRTVVHSVIASAEKTSLSAMRSAFYEIMRKRRVRPIGVLPWVTFGCSVATCTSLLVYGDGIECAIESLPAAPSIACLGRGIESLHQASQAVEQTESSRIQKSIESLVSRFKKWKLAP